MVILQKIHVIKFSVKFAVGKPEFGREADKGVRYLIFKSEIKDITNECKTMSINLSRVTLYEFNTYSTQLRIQKNQLLYVRAYVKSANYLKCVVFIYF